MSRLSRVNKNTTPQRSVCKRISYKHTSPVVTLPGGCAIEIDCIGLPASPRISHNGDQCVCRGHQAALLLKYLQQWLQTDAAVFQIEIKSAFALVRGLTSLWGLEMAREAVESELQEWQQGLEGALNLENPLLSGRVSGAGRQAMPRRLVYDI
jgi:hypothetical protein